MKKRSLALLLALAVCLTLLPNAALAEEGTVGSEPAKVITSGIKWWWDLNAPDKDNFVADSFSADCAYYLNDTPVSADAVKTAAAKRGTVVEVYTNANSEIGMVKAYEYTAELEGDDVILVCKLDRGDGTYSYTREKAEKVTGQVTTFSTKGEITISSTSGTSYQASGQKAADGVSEFEVSEELFSDWSFRGGSFTEEYNFYLDKNGSIVAIQSLTKNVGTSQVCMVTEAVASWDGTELKLWPNLLFMDGTTKNVTVSKLNGRSVVPQVTQADSQIAVEDARQALGAPETKFFSYRFSTDGYELTEMNAAEASGDWEDPVTRGDGSSPVATVVSESRFAKAPGTTSDLEGWNISANENTRFVLCQRNGIYTPRYTALAGFRRLHGTDITRMVAICTNTSSQTDTVARFVYLEVAPKQTGETPEVKAPEGYIFIRENSTVIDLDPTGNAVYRIQIVASDGRYSEMQVTEELGETIAADPMIVSRTRNYVGHFFAIGAMDKNGVVSSLTNGAAEAAPKPVALRKLTGIGDEVITLRGGVRYDYDSETQFIYVDMGWMDGEEEGNTLGVLEKDRDTVYYLDSSSFWPNGFFNPEDVSAEDPNATYASVNAAVICPKGSKTADYVYVLRTIGWSYSDLVAVTGVSLPKTASVQEGKTKTLTATVQPDDADDKGVYWTSDDTAVVMVDAGGKITGVKAGTANVTITTVDGGFTATCAVTVTKATTSGGGGGGGGSSSSGSSGGGTTAKPSAQPTTPPSATPSAKPTIDTSKPASENFSDVVKDSWYEDGVTYVVQKGLFQGVADRTFAPQQNMTRAMLVTVLARLDGQSTEGGATWYAKGTDWAKAQGVSDGTMLDQSVTREQMVTMLYRYAKAAAGTVNLSKFADADKVSAWARDAMAWAVEKGILTGKDGNRLDPQGTATRAEVATILQRFVEKS